MFLSIILQVNDTTALVRRGIEEYYSDFYKHWPFIIEIFVALVGLRIGYIAWKEARNAFREAKLAKEAAQKAANAVKKNTILIMLLETISACTIKDDTSFEVVNEMLTKVGRNINKLLGIYSKSDNETLKSKLQEILDLYSATHAALNDFEVAADGEVIYKKINPSVTKVSLELSRVQGELENELNSLV